MWPS
ncbi:uncharacterized protein FFNC_05429 [Fusarium fujikuroi]